MGTNCYWCQKLQVSTARAVERFKAQVRKKLSKESPVSFNKADWDSFPKYDFRLSSQPSRRSSDRKS